MFGPIVAEFRPDSTKFGLAQIQSNLGEFDKSFAPDGFVESVKRARRICAFAADLVQSSARVGRSGRARCPAASAAGAPTQAGLCWGCHVIDLVSIEWLRGAANSSFVTLAVLATGAALELLEVLTFNSGTRCSRGEGRVGLGVALPEPPRSVPQHRCRRSCCAPRRR